MHKKNMHLRIQIVMSRKICNKSIIRRIASEVFLTLCNFRIYKEQKENDTFASNIRRER